MTKSLVYIGIPSLDGRLTAALSGMLFNAGLLSLCEDHPYRYYPDIPIGDNPIDYARNRIVERFLSRKDAEWLYFIDDDMAPPLSWWALVGREQGIVSGLTYGWQSGRRSPQRAPSLRCVQFYEDDQGFVAMDPQGTEPYSVDGVGMACSVIRREVLEGMSPPWFFIDKEPESGKSILSEDLYFCRKARASGAAILADPRIVFGHQKRIDLIDVGTYGLNIARRGAASQGAPAPPRDTRPFILPDEGEEGAA